MRWRMWGTTSGRRSRSSTKASGDADVTPIEVHRATMEAMRRFGNRPGISARSWRRDGGVAGTSAPSRRGVRRAASRTIPPGAASVAPRCGIGRREERAGDRRRRVPRPAKAIQLQVRPPRAARSRRTASRGGGARTRRLRSALPGRLAGGARWVECSPASASAAAPSRSCVLVSPRQPPSRAREHRRHQLASRALARREREISAHVVRSQRPRGEG